MRRKRLSTAILTPADDLNEGRPQVADVRVVDQRGQDVEAGAPGIQPTQPGPTDLQDPPPQPAADGSGAAARPAVDGLVWLPVTAHITVNGKLRLPGDWVQVTADRAASLRYSGYAAKA